MPDVTFQGRRVVAFESRRAAEMATLVTTFGGEPVVAPALREVPLESNTDALAFVGQLIDGQYDAVVFLTGVGTRALAELAAQAYSRDAFVDALARTKVIARGPKPVGVLRELQVPVWLTAPEPNTSRDLLDALDARTGASADGARPVPAFSLPGARIAVQEYGSTNTELLDALGARGALVTPVPVYRWALPEDLGPLRAAVTTLADGRADVVLFTTGVQVVHLWRVVQDMGLESDVRQGIARAVVASIGPTTSEELRRHGLPIDLEASHPRIGFLVREAAREAAGLLDRKRATT